MKNILLALSLGVILVLVAVPAKADTITSWSGYLTSDHCTGGCGTPPFGEVLLNQVGSDVLFTVTLYDESTFVRTGAGSFMSFLFNGVEVEESDISGAGLTADSGAFGTGASGAFEFGVYFTGQETGGKGNAGPLVFTVQDALIEDLIQVNDRNQIFIADIYSSQTGLTGLVDVSSGGTPTVPEPSTMVLLGLGLLGMAAVRKYKK